MDFDVVVLGSGPGGYVAAIRAAQLGLRTAVVEEKYWGGVCLNVGCIPSKALLRNAELAHIMTEQRKTFGIEVDGTVRFDYGAAYRRSRSVADGRVKGVHFLMRKNQITEYNGHGTFVDPHTITVDGQPITFHNAIIADRRDHEAVARHEPVRAGGHLRGADPERDPAEEHHHRRGGRDRGRVRVRPQRNYGVDVTIVEFLDRMVPTEDAEVSAELAKWYRRLGIQVLTSTRVESIEDTATGYG